MKKVEYILRVGVFLTFIGHGTFAYQVRPEWVVYLTTAGLTVPSAHIAMHYIGMLDYLIAFAVLLRPMRIILLWAVFWTMATALIRPLSGLSWLEFFERGANWAAPLALLFIRGLPRQARDLFK